MSDKSDFFQGLAVQRRANVSVETPDVQTVYQDCCNRCKVLGFSSIFNLKQSSPALSDICSQQCRSFLYEPPSIPRTSSRQVCRQYALDNDTLYVKCLRKNHIPWTLSFTSCPTPPLPHSLGGMSSENEDKTSFVIDSNQSLPPDATLFSCANTLNGTCVRGVSLKDCIQLCQDSDLCTMGYFLQTKDNPPETFCAPLLNNASVMSQKNIKDLYTLSSTATPLKDAYDATFFYRRSVDYDTTPAPPTTNIFSTFLIEAKYSETPMYVTDDLTISGLLERATRWLALPIFGVKCCFASNMMFRLNKAETRQILTMNEKNRFIFENSNVAYAYDSTIVFSEKHVVFQFIQENVTASYFDPNQKFHIRMFKTQYTAKDKIFGRILEQGWLRVNTNSIVFDTTHDPVWHDPKDRLYLFQCTNWNNELYAIPTKAHEVKWFYEKTFPFLSTETPSPSPPPSSTSSGLSTEEDVDQSSSNPWPFALLLVWIILTCLCIVGGILWVLRHVKHKKKQRSTIYKTN